jgi:hypothetical protein
VFRALRTILLASLLLPFSVSVASAKPPAAREGKAKPERVRDSDQGKAPGWLERVVEDFGDEGARERRNPNSNAQWLPDAKRGQERAAERRPAHAGPEHAPAPPHRRPGKVR